MLCFEDGCLRKERRGVVGGGSPRTGAGGRKGRVLYEVDGTGSLGESGLFVGVWREGWGRMGLG